MTVIAENLWMWTGLADADTRHRAVREHLASVLGCVVEDVSIIRDKLGRPIIEKPKVDLHFSQARRDDVVVLAVARGRLVGVDVESLAGPSDSGWMAKVAGDFFAETERQWLQSLPQSDRAEGFVRLWTGKEAVLKALGLGIASGMAQPDLSHQLLAGCPLLEDEMKAQAHGRHFTLCWWRLQEGETPLILCRAMEAC